MVKTILIYNELETELKFRAVDGDYSHLDGKFINDMETTEDEANQINELVFYPEGHEKAWRTRDEFALDFPTKVIEENPGEVKVIQIGFLP